MRFFADGPDIPLELLEARDKGEVIFLCGAGISMPAGLPSFNSLTRSVVQRLGAPDNSFTRPFLDRQEGVNENGGELPALDQVFGYLQREYGSARVERVVSQLLRTPRSPRLDHHRTILRLSSDMRGRPRIITTNFDLLFEKAAPHIRRYAPPHFPDLRSDASFDGLVYLHGRLNGAAREPDELQGLVLGVGDLGRAYLSDGWATRFLKELLTRYTVVLLGYSANDTPIHYLLEGLRSRGSRTRLFAFAEGVPGTTDTRWWDRGVEAIPYPATGNHSALWRSLSAWADRAEDPEKWHAATLHLGQRGPRSLDPHERGQVVAMASTIDGASAIADDAVPLPAEWLCVFDSRIRWSEPQRSYGSEEVFDPLQAYRLDSDPRRTEEPQQKSNSAPPGLNVLEPLRELERGPNNARAASLSPARAASLPVRLNHLARWIGRVSHDPIAVWWAGHYFHIHESVKDYVEFNLRQSTDVAPTVRLAWNLSFEASQGRPSFAITRDWHELLRVISRDGWTAAAWRQLRGVLRPRLSIETARFYGSQPPLDEDIPLPGLIAVKIEFVGKSTKNLKVPDSSLVDVVACLRDGLRHAASLKSDTGADMFARTPTLHPAEGPGTVFISEDDAYFLWFVELFRRLAAADPAAAGHELAIWPQNEPCYFDKLRIWAWMMPGIAPIDLAVNHLLTLSQSVFWNSYNQRELLWTLRARWTEMTAEHRSLLEARLLSGPDQWASEDEDDFRRRRKISAATRLGWLHLNGCTLSRETMSTLPDLRAADPEWQTGWDTSADHSYEGRSGWVRTDSDPSTIIDAPLGEVVARLQSVETQPRKEFVRVYPFQGLVEARPGRALAVLTHEARKNSFPEGLWRSLLQSAKAEAPRRFRWAVSHRLARLPQSTLVSVSSSACQWIKNHLPQFFAAYPESCLSVWGSIFGAIERAGAESTASALGDISIGGVKQTRSRRTFQYAVNGPVGDLAETLMDFLKAANNAGSPRRIPECIKCRLERCVSAPGEGADHAACILGFHLRWLRYLDERWTKRALMPMFELDHTLAEPFWSGFLWQKQLPDRRLFAAIKPNFLRAISDATKWAWGEGEAPGLTQFLVAAVFAGKGDGAYITRPEAREALQSTNDEGRVAALDQLRSMIEDEKDWRRRGPVFFAEVWPSGLRFQTPATSSVIAEIVVRTRTEFPKAVQAVLALLQPIPDGDSIIHSLIEAEETESSKPLAVQYPVQAILFIDRLIADQPTYLPYNLREILRITSEAEPSLRLDLRWRRLNNLAIGR